MTKKILPIIILVVIVVGAGAFYGGMQYSKSQSKGSLSGGFANLTPEERQARFQQMGAGNGSSQRMGQGAGAGFVNGEILSKDNQSLTIKLRDGGSKIVLFSTSTEVSRFIEGELNDLTVGQSVMVNGRANADGSITAQSIQVRPEIKPSDVTK